MIARSKIFNIKSIYYSSDKFNNKMDHYRINIDDCIKFNKTTMTMKFSDHVYNETIVIEPFKLFPFLHYEDEDYNDESTPWFNVCGSIILLFRELARFRHAW